MGVWDCFDLLTFSFSPHLFHALFLPSQQSVSPAQSCVAVACWHSKQSHHVSLSRCHPGPCMAQGSLCFGFGHRIIQVVQRVTVLPWIFWVLKCCCFCRHKLANWFQWTCGNSPFTYSTRLYCKVQVDLQAAYLGMSHPSQECRDPFCTSNMTQQGVFIWKV